MKARGLLEQIDKVLYLLKPQTAAQHRMNDLLKIEMLEDRGAQVATSAEGTIHILLWKP